MILSSRSLIELPEQRNQYPYGTKTTNLFTTLAKDRNFFGLRVPSTLVPLEHNFILNPLYKNFGQVEIIEFLELPIDQRLKSPKQKN